MDPASATITFVGFAASLATIASLVVNSSKTLYNLRRRLKHAPGDIELLLRQLRDYELLLSEVQHWLQQDDQAEHVSTPGLRMLLARVGEQMHKDMEGFTDVMRRAEGLLEGHATVTLGKCLILRIRHILQEGTVREYQRLISSHVGILTFLLTILNK
jgi:hypothetical protein